MGQQVGMSEAKVGLVQREDDDDAARPLAADVARSLVENHRDFLRFLERRVGRRDVAEDILQEEPRQ